MKKILFLIALLIAALFLIGCSVSYPVNAVHKPLRIDDLSSDEPLIIKGPFLDKDLNPPSMVYIVTNGYVKLHKELWKKAYPQSKDAEGITRSRLLIQYEDYKAKYKGDDVTFRSAWKVRAELVEFVKSVLDK
jgi:hypothetical protein